jgi:riboflavin synthase
MFTGIVEAIGKVVRASDGSAEADTPAQRLDIAAPGLFNDLRPGASVAVNGACLTLTRWDHDVASFDVVPETWHKTNLHALRPGHLVNLERSLRPADRLDGHFVQGHVDGLGRVARIDRAGDEWKLWVIVDRTLSPYILRKGSVALDGVSLTIVDVTGDSFSVALIPTTLERTTVGQRRPGDLVNIETDILARVVFHQLAAAGLLGTDQRPPATGLTLESLREGGYIE